MAAPATIPFAANDPVGTQIPDGLMASKTPQGGSAYQDAQGNLYLKGLTNYYIAPSTLPGNTAPTPPGQEGQGNIDATQAPTVASNSATLPSATATVTPPPTNADGSPQKTAAQIQSETDAVASGAQTSSAGVRTSASIEDELNNNLASLNQPTLPNSNDETADANAQPGSVNDITTQLNSAQTDYDNLEANIQNQQANIASRPGVVAALVGGQMKMISAENAYALSEAKTNIDTLTKSLTQAQAAVKAIVANTDTDYKNAEAQYQFQYTKYLTQYTDEESQLDKATTAAKANAQVIIASYKGSTVGASNVVTPANQALWAQIEQSAGLPEGTISAAIQNELSVDKFVKGDNGYEYVTGTDSSGAPYTARIVGSYGEGTTKNPPAGDVTNSATGLTKDQQTQATAFGKALSAGQTKMQGTTAVTREQFTRELQGEFPSLNASTIQNYVYAMYPDNWQTAGVNTAAAPQL